MQHVTHDQVVGHSGSGKMCAACEKPLTDDGFFAMGALYHQACFRLGRYGNKDHHMMSNVTKKVTEKFQCDENRSADSDLKLGIGMRRRIPASGFCRRNQLDLIDRGGRLSRFANS